jgi:hypothetical protein
MNIMDLKFEYTENNHFKWGFGGEWYNKPDPTKQYQIQLGHTTRPIQSFRQECINTARLIASKATKPICVGLSGGSDSQMACLSFMQADIPFKTVIVSMVDADGRILNDHDIKNAYAFCEKYNIEYIDFKINPDEFYATKGKEYAAKYGFTGVHVLLQCATMDFICPDYCYIMAGGDIVFAPYKKTLTPDLDLPELDNVPGVAKPVWWQTPLPIMQHMMAMGYEGTSKFYLYTPELIVAYLTDPAVKDFLNTQDVIYEVFIRWLPHPRMWWRCFHMLFKPLMTQREWPEMLPARKYTGFEQLQGKNFNSGKEMLYQAYVDEAAGGISSGQVIATPIADLITYLTTPHTHNLVATRKLSGPNA